MSGRLHPYQVSLYEYLSKKWVFMALTMLPAAVVFLSVNLFPIGWALSASFFEISAYSPLWEWNGLGNFEKVLNDAAFWASLGRSSLFAVGSVALQVAFGTALAFLINREFRGQKLVRAVALLPYIVPTAVLAYVALWMGSSNFGIINQLLVRVGVIDQFIPWFGSIQWAMFAVISVASWKFSIFVTILVLARLQSIPDSLYEAAAISGASYYRRFVDITLPNLKGVLFIAILLRSIWMFNKFDIVFILTNGGPADVTRIASIHAYQTAFVEANLGEAAAVSTFLFGLLVIAAAVYFTVFEPSQEVRVE